MSLRKKLTGSSIVALVVWLTVPASGQETPIVEIPFESLPDGLLVQGPGGISLDGNVTVNQNLNVAGIVESDSGGFRFPDGSFQTTAATVVVGASASAGLYDNRIVEMTPPQPFSEICFKNGQALGDIHVSSESSAGGNCLPGDLGFILERNQRAAANWKTAGSNACWPECGFRNPSNGFTAATMPALSA
jgi:hypothetical protein